MRILICDTETQGLGPFAKPPREDLVIEIGCVIWCTESKAIVTTWSDLICAESNDAEPINRIPAPLLKAGSSREHAMATLVNLAQRADVVVAHEASFDHAFLGDVNRGSLFDPPIIPWVCSKRTIEWPLSKPGDGLVYVATNHKVPVTDTHRALSDCLLIARCFERVSEMGHDVEAMILRAMRPRALYQSKQGFAENDKAKAAGFTWNADKKQWLKTIAIDDAPAFIATLPFNVERVAE